MPQLFASNILLRHFLLRHFLCTLLSRRGIWTVPFICFFHSKSKYIAIAGVTFLSALNITTNKETICPIWGLPNH